MNWITLWEAAQTRGSGTHAYRKQIITRCAPGDNWLVGPPLPPRKGRRWPGQSVRDPRRRTGVLAAPRWPAPDAVIFGYFSKMVNNLSEFKLTVATGGPLEEIKIPGSNDGNCRRRQEVIDKWGDRK